MSIAGMAAGLQALVALSPGLSRGPVDLGGALEPGYVERWASAGGRLLSELGDRAGWLAERTGLPMLVLAAAALVIALRLARRVGRIAVEFALALLLLVTLRELGWAGF